MSTFWSLWITVITLGVMAGSLWLLIGNRKTIVRGDLKEGEIPTTGHNYDGIEEYDNPLPAWWFWGFIITVIFGAVYLTFYPGLGAFKGVLGWSSQGQWEQEVDKAEATMGKIYADFAATPIEQLAADPRALKMGRRIFNNNCAVCHGVGGVGANGFPNLTDNDWLYGGEPETIKLSIVKGRQGAMPAWGAVLGDEGVANVTQYVLQLSGNEHDASAAQAGAAQFQAFCASCHGPDGKGNHQLGAPNLTDNIWLYSQANLTLEESIGFTLRNGRNGVMPAQEALLRPEKIHLLATYVYNLSHTK